jgi:C1A family cysteine protease
LDSTHYLVTLASEADRLDLAYQFTSAPTRALVDLRPWCTPVEDQFRLGSCTANAIANAFELMVNLIEPHTAVDLSRLFIYYNSRLMNGVLNEDAGASLNDSLIGMANYGACSEALWPYNTDKFKDRPTEECYQDGLSRRITAQRPVTDVAQIIAELNNNKPVVFGVAIYHQFYRVTAENSVVALPLTSDRELGSHAMCMVGYDDQQKLFLAKNSFGTDWGDQGYCWFTYDYIRTYGVDMWVFDIP